MTIKQLGETTKTKGQDHHKSTPMSWLLLALVFALIATFNSAAMHDRMLLFLYSIGISGAAFAMLKRGALVFTAMTLAAAATALLVNVYFQTFTESWHPTMDAVRDIIGLSMIAFVTAKLMQEIHRNQQSAKLAQDEVITAS